MFRKHYLPILLMLSLVLPVKANQTLADIEQQISAGQYPQVLAQLDKLLAKDRTHPHYLFFRARALAAGGQQDKAIAQYEELIKHHPGLPEPYNNLAVIYMQMGQSEKARSLLNKGMATHPAYTGIYKNLIAINTSKAQHAYARALQIQGERPMAGLQTANTLSLPEKPVPSVRPAPVVTAAAKSTKKPSLIYKAPPNRADKKTVVTTKNASQDIDGFNEARLMLQAWARAWATKNVDQYLQFYMDGYTPSGMNRQYWESQRRQRINRPEWIRVKLRNFRLKASGGQQMTIYLEQEYSADNYSDVTRKEFVVQKVLGEWRIIKERGLGYLTQ